MEMSFEDFEILDNNPIDNTISKRGFLKVHHHRQATLNDPD